MMDLDELRSVQSRERQTDSLQQLRASFYRDAAEYIQSLEAERGRAADRADDPWNSPEVSRLNDDIDAAEGTVEAIYERRVGKIVKMASLAAADMPTDDEGLTAEERDLFETLVDAIEDNREQVLALLDGAPHEDGEVGAGTGRERRTESEPEPESGPEPAPGTGADAESDAGRAPDRDETTGVDAADVMGGEPAGRDRDRDWDRGSESDEDPETGGGRRDAAGRRSDAAAAQSGDTGSGRQSGGAGSGGPTDAAGAGGAEPAVTAPGAGGGVETKESSRGSTGETDVERTTVKVTSDVGEIFGVDERAYDLTTDDVVTLPEANADPLVERGAAERLD